MTDKAVREGRGNFVQTVEWTNPNAVVKKSSREIYVYNDDDNPTISFILRDTSAKGTTKRMDGLINLEPGQVREACAILLGVTEADISLITMKPTIQESCENFAKRVLGDEAFANSPAQAHPLQLVEEHIADLITRKPPVKIMLADGDDREVKVWWTEMNDAGVLEVSVQVVDPTKEERVAVAWEVYGKTGRLMTIVTNDEAAQEARDYGLTVLPLYR